LRTFEHIGVGIGRERMGQFGEKDIVRAKKGSLRSPQESATTPANTREWTRKNQPRRVVFPFYWWWVVDRSG